MKNFILLLTLLLCCGMTAHSQWASPGVQIHTGANPVIQKSDPLFFLSNLTADSKTSIIYRFGSANRTYLTHYDDTDEFTIGNSIDPALTAFGINVNTGVSRLSGKLNFNGTGNVKIEAEGDEMLYYDKTNGRASWGFDAIFNRFAKPINIGSTLIPESDQSLVTSGGLDMALVGDNSYIYWYTGANSDHTGAHSCFVGSNQAGAFFVESNLSEVNIDGETGVNFLGSDNARARMDPQGRWVLGSYAVDPLYRLCVLGDVKINGELFTTSDARMKRNIQPISDGLSKVMDLNPVSYEYKYDEYKSLESQEDVQIGFLAQEVEEIFPELVSTSVDTDNDGNTIDAKSINYVQLIPMLTKAIQEQQTIIEAQSKALKEHETLIQELRAAINK